MSDDDRDGAAWAGFDVFDDADCDRFREAARGLFHDGWPHVARDLAADGMSAEQIDRVFVRLRDEARTRADQAISAARARLAAEHTTSRVH